MYGVPLQTRQFETIGIAMHPWMTNISHSCEPNSIVNFDHVSRCGGDHRLRINPLRNIARDEKITIEYFDGSIPLSLRTKELRSNYFFECKCANCVRESVHGLGHLLPEQLSTLERVRDLVGAAETDTTRRMPVQRLRYALHLLLSCSWAPEHYPFCFILRKLVSAYVADEQYNLAFAHSLVLRRAAKSLYKKRPGRSHPMALADLYVMLRLMDKIIGAQGWASQELDLASRKLNLVGLRRLWADKLCSLSSNVYSWSLPRFDGSRYIEGIRRLDFTVRCQH